MSDATSKSVTCVRLIRDTTPSLYALPTDGRKCKEQQAKRRALAMQLATFADGDGTRIMPGADRLAAALGWSRDTLFWYLNDLKTLGFLQNEAGRTGSHGTKRRSLNLAAIKLAVRNSQSRSPKLAASESEIESSQSEIGVSESEVHPHTTDTLTDTQTDHNKPASKKPSSAVVVGGEKTPSQLKAARERIIGLFIELEKEAPDTTRAHDKAIDGLIAKYGEETVGKVLRRDLQDSAFFVGKDGARTKFPLARFIGRFDRLLKELEVTASNSKLTKEVIDRTNEVANKRHEAVWAGKDEPDPNPDEF